MHPLHTLVFAMIAFTTALTVLGTAPVAAQGDAPKPASRCLALGPRSARRALRRPRRPPPTGRLHAGAGAGGERAHPLRRPLDLSDREPRRPPRRDRLCRLGRAARRPARHARRRDHEPRPFLALDGDPEPADRHRAARLGRRRRSGRPLPAHRGRRHPLRPDRHPRLSRRPRGGAATRSSSSRRPISASAISAISTRR